MLTVGLLAIMEKVLQPIMYDIPSDPTVTRVTITGACVKGEGNPAIERDPARLAPAKDTNLKPTIA